MSCLFPMDCWRGKPNENGKRPVVFRRSDSYQMHSNEDISLQVPCGKCLGCRADESMSWAIRSYQEASLHKQNCFVTLTYNDENLPNSLVKSDLQKFIRNCRDEGRKIRYLACGEYGDSTNRPHYHACVFGTDFRNGTEFKVNEELYSVPSLSEMWGKGNVILAEFNMATACYVAGYVMKKNKEKEDDSFRLMSRKPGLGFTWLEKYYESVLKTGSVIIEGRELPVPRPYLRWAEEKLDDVLDPIKKARLRRFKEMPIEKVIDKRREAKAKQTYHEQQVKHQKEKKKL